MVDLFRTANRNHPMAGETGYRLADPDMQAMHPALQLFQSWLDPRDGQNYGALLRNPPDEVPRKHLFYLHDVDATEIAPKMSTLLSHQCVSKWSVSDSLRRQKSQKPSSPRAKN